MHAKWAGGPDGGSWFNCRRLPAQWHYHCVVYREFNGEVMDEGEYVLSSVYWNREQGKAVNEPLDSLTLDYSFLDSDSVALTNSLTLVKVSTKN
jgi:hypothetical protein